MGNALKELPHLDIVDGVVLLEHGRVEVGLEVHLPSVLFDSADRVEGDWATMRAILQMALPLKSRARFYIEAAPDRGEALKAYQGSIKTQNPFPKAVAEARLEFLNQERVRGKLLSWRAFLTIDMDTGYKEMVLSPEALEEVLQNARDLRQRIAEYLTAGGFRVREMDTQEVFDLLWRWLNPSLASAPAPRYLSLLESGTPIVPGKAAAKLGNWHQMTARAQAAGSIINNLSDRFAVVGDKLVDAVALFTAPDETFMGMLSDVLANIPGAHLYLVAEYRHNPLEPVVAKLQADARKYMALAEGEGMRDFTAKGKLKEVEKAIDALVESGDHVYDASVSVLLVADTVEEIRLLREQALSALSKFPGARPTYGTGLGLRLYYALAPFNGKTSPFLFMVPTTNAADFAPTSLPWKGMDRPAMVYRNRFNALTGIDPFDPGANNWNGLIVAGSGSGKTFFSQSYLTGLLAQGEAEVIIVDRGGGYIPLVEALAGREVIIPIEPGTISINPFDLPEGANEPSEDKKSFLFGIIRSMVPPADDPEIASIEDAILLSAIDQTYKRKTEEVRDPITGAYTKRYTGATLSDLVSVLLRLDDIGGRAATTRDKEVAKVLATRLQVWTGDTPFGTFVDRPTSIRTDYPVIYFETTGLDRYPQLQGPALLLLADIIWRRAEKDHRVRKLVIMDEVWAMLDIPQARKLIVELYRRARRYNTAIYSISQSIMDFTAIPGIIQNTTYFFLGMLPRMEHQEIKRILNVPDSVLEALASLKMVRGKFSEWVFYTFLNGVPEGEVIRVEPSPLEYWIYTTNPADMAKRAALVQQGYSVVEAARKLAEGVKP